MSFNQVGVVTHNKRVAGALPPLAMSPRPHHSGFTAVGNYDVQTGLLSRVYVRSQARFTLLWNHSHMKNVLLMMQFCTSKKPGQSWNCHLVRFVSTFLKQNSEASVAHLLMVCHIINQPHVILQTSSTKTRAGFSALIPCQTLSAGVTGWWRSSSNSTVQDTALTGNGTGSCAKIQGLKTDGKDIWL